MKLALPLSIISLLISVVCVFMVWSIKKSDQERVDIALQEREEELVQNFKPKFEQLFEGQNLQLAENYDPKTLEELFAPMIELIIDMEE